MDAETPLRLDHASLKVAALEPALRQLSERLGLEVTRTPGAPGFHGRLYLHRSYVEVSTTEGGVLPAGQQGALPLFFLNAEDLAAAASRLKVRGLGSSPRTYQGVDGLWEELEPEAPDGVPVPLVIRRVEPAEVARDWPPPNPRPHPCGAFSLAGVIVATSRLESAWDVYHRLLGLEAGPDIRMDGRFAVHRIDLPLPEGRLVLVEPSGPGLARDWLAERGPGPTGLLFGVESLAPTESFLAARGVGAERVDTQSGPELWLDPADTFGVPVGFTGMPPPR